jgi:hypothetical protein
MSFLAKIQTGDVAQAISENQELLDPVRQFILDNFGQNGLYAAYLVAIAIVIVLLYKLVKFSFELIFFIALPSVISAFVLTFFLPYNFFYLLPVTAALFTLGLVLKTVGLSKG